MLHQQVTLQPIYLFQSHYFVFARPPTPVHGLFKVNSIIFHRFPSSWENNGSGDHAKGTHVMLALFRSILPCILTAYSRFQIEQVRRRDSESVVFRVAFVEEMSVFKRAHKVYILYEYIHQSRSMQNVLMSIKAFSDVLAYTSLGNHLGNSVPQVQCQACQATRALAGHIRSRNCEHFTSYGSKLTVLAQLHTNRNPSWANRHRLEPPH